MNPEHNYPLAVELEFFRSLLKEAIDINNKCYANYNSPVFDLSSEVLKILHNYTGTTYNITKLQKRLFTENRTLEAEHSVVYTCNDVALEILVYLFHKPNGYLSNVLVTYLEFIEDSQCERYQQLEEIEEKAHKQLNAIWWDYLLGIS